MRVRRFSLKVTVSSVFIITCLIGGVILLQYLSLKEHQRQQEISNTAHDIASRLEQRLNQAYLATEVLRIILQSQEGKLPQFEPLSDALLQRYDGISNLQLAPKGIITQVYPLAGNESVIGHNVLLSDFKRQDAQTAMQQQHLTVAGPFNLKQGGIGIVARNPVYIGDLNEFWGFASALMVIDDLLPLKEQQQLTASGYQFNLRRLDDNNTVSIGATPPFNRSVAQSEIQLGNSQWRFTLARTRNDDYLMLTLGSVITLLIATLMSGFTLLLLQRPQHLSDAIAERTRELERMAFTDSLTQLGNREYMHHKLRETIHHIDKTHSTAALLFIGIDSFRRINDSFGHEVGDHVLVTMAKRLQQHCRSNDYTARLSGDEFAILMPFLHSEAEAQKLIEVTRSLLLEPLLLAQNPVTISNSAGLVLLPRHGNSVELLMKRADIALHWSKAHNKGATALYTEEMEQQVHQQLALELELRQALDKREFVLHFQPIIDIQQHRLVGFEVLLRWQHQGKLVYPDDFIPIAEYSGLIVNIGNWIIKASCAALREFNDDTLRLSVNLSAPQLLDKELVSYIQSCLLCYQLEPQRLVLEITETMLMDNLDEAIATLTELRELGCGIAVDDFGTGYSSLAKLKQLPITSLKIDREFVKDIPESKDDIEITRTIIEMGQRFDLRVVAEGIETREQLDLLRHYHCDYGQGYFFSKPVDKKSAMALIDQYQDSNALK